jgi:hypothetical protein
VQIYVHNNTVQKLRRNIFDDYSGIAVPSVADLDPVGSASFVRIRIRNNSLVANPDPDLRLQNWHLINLFSAEKYCE